MQELREAELLCQLPALFPTRFSAGGKSTQARREVRGRPARKELQPRAPNHQEIVDRRGPGEQPSKLATVSQIAAPMGGQVSFKSGYHLTLLDPPAALESGDSFADRSPPRMARSHLGLGRASLCWTPQQPSKVVTVSQIAAPQGWRGLI